VLNAPIPKNRIIISVIRFHDCSSDFKTLGPRILDSTYCFLFCTVFAGIRAPRSISAINRLFTIGQSSQFEPIWSQSWDFVL